MCDNVCESARACVRYTRDQVQSWAIERMEKEEGELIRKQGKLQSVPIDNLTPHFKRIYVHWLLQSPLKIIVRH